MALGLVFQLAIVAVGMLTARALLRPVMSRPGGAWPIGLALLVGSLGRLLEHGVDAPWAASWACMGLAGTALLVVPLRPAPRNALAARWRVLLAEGLAAIFMLPLALGSEPFDATNWLGSGGHAFLHIQDGSSGLATLIGVVGYPAALWLVLGLAWVISGAGPMRIVVMTLATLAWLAGGGMFTPAATLALAATVGGLAPRPARLGRNGLAGTFIMVGLALVLAALAMGRDVGLAGWAARGYFHDEAPLHFSAGILLTLALAWLLGSRFGPAGALAGCAASLALAGMGELAQFLATRAGWTRRGVSLGDWLMHLYGSLPAIALCLGWLVLPRRAGRRRFPGKLSRVTPWLLAGCAALAVSGLWAGFPPRNTEIQLGGMITRGTRSAGVVVRFGPRRRWQWCGPVQIHFQDRPREFLHFSFRAAGTERFTAPLGDWRVTAWGNPYGDLAGQRSEGWWRVLDANAPIAFMDSRLVEDLAGSGDLGALLGLLQAEGQVLAVPYGDEDGQINTCRRLIRPYAPRAAVFHTSIYNGWDKLGLKLRRLGRGPKGLTVVTADAELARQALTQGIETHFIGQTRLPNAPTTRNLHCWPDVHDFIEHLRSD